MDVAKIKSKTCSSYHVVLYYANDSVLLNDNFVDFQINLTAIFEEYCKYRQQKYLLVHKTIKLQC